MKLPSLLSRKKEEREVFLSLLLYPDAVDAAVWELSPKIGATILGAVTQDLVHDSWDERTEATDKCVSALEDLAKTTNITKVILGLPSNYLTQDGDILKEARPHIKKLTQALGLEPIGFVSIYQALVHKYKKDEGVPASVILLGVTDGTATVSLYRVGTLVGQQTIPLKEGLGERLEETLSSFSDVEIMPSRILLYGTKPSVLEHVKRELLRHPWQKKTKFLHVPKVDILPGDGAAIAVSHAGSAELTHDIGEEADLGEEAVETESLPVTAPRVEEEIVEEEEEEAVEAEAEAEPDPIDEEELEAEEEEHANVVPVNASAFGFQSQENDAEPELEEMEEVVEEESRPSPSGRKKISVPIKIPIAGIVKKIKRLFTKKGSFGLLLIPLILIVLLGGGGYVLGTSVLPSATIEITTTPKTLEKNQLVTIDPSITEISTEQSTIPGIKAEESESGEKTIPATGKKTIGDAAQGTVTIFNKSTVSRTFKKGTVLSAGSLDFTLDDDVAIASASESLAQGTITYGKANGKVTAKQIGTNGNITAGKDFSISGVSSTIATARNEQAFTGGTSKDVTIVSRADQDAIVKQLTTDLTEKVKEAFDSAQRPETLIAETIKTQVSEKVFSQEVGQEAKEINGKITVKISAVGYKKEDITKLIEEMIINDVPEGYALEPGKTEVSVSGPKIAKDGTIRLDATASAHAVPSLPVSSLLTDLSGKTVEEAQKILKDLSGVNDVQITIHSSLLKNRLPKRAQRITITTK